jgi:hypothetical protein
MHVTIARNLTRQKLHTICTSNVSPRQAPQFVSLNHAPQKPTCSTFPKSRPKKQWARSRHKFYVSFLSDSRTPTRSDEAPPLQGGAQQHMSSHFFLGGDRVHGFCNGWCNTLRVKGTSHLTHTHRRGESTDVCVCVCVRAAVGAGAR